MEMVADGYSCSSFLKTPDCASLGVRKVAVRCLRLPRLLREHGVEASAGMFVKIHTEGAEALILPSLQSWIASAKPTLFVSMHNTADAQQWSNDRVRACSSRVLAGGPVKRRQGV